MHHSAVCKTETETMTISRAKILIVDDEPSIRRLLKKLLEKEGYACLVAETADSAVDVLSVNPVDLVISDISMPGKSGIELLEEIRKQFPAVATMIMTGMASPKNAEIAISLGAYGYLYKPFQKRQVLASVANVLRRRSMDLQNKFELENMEQIIDEKDRYISNADNKINNILESIIRAMSLAIESRDPYTAGHQHRVGNLAAAIASMMGYSDEHTRHIRMAGMIHDIGKISVPAELLSKPGKLSEAEMSIIKDHPQVGYNILKEIDFPYPLAEVIYQHHERLDGSGYPLGLKNEDIYLDAKILAVADVVEAMISHRPYRPAMGIDAALAEISKNKERHYDPEVVDVCSRICRDDGFELIQANQPQSFLPGGNA